MRSKSQTEGISPKVYIPFVVGVVVGTVLIVTGQVEDGKAVLFSVLGAAGVGVVASPGKVRQR